MCSIAPIRRLGGRRRRRRLLRAADGRARSPYGCGALAARGRLVLLGDPGRAYLPRQGLRERARYLVPTSRELEDRESRDTVVWEVLPA